VSVMWGVGPVLVVAPHPDDETIGCGGVIRLYTLSTTPVTIVFVSDGRKGGGLGELARKEKTLAEEQLAATRRQEAQRAAGVLGVSDLVFLDLRDGEVQVSQENVRLLREQLSRLRPDVVFLPFLVDQHPDHLGTNALFLEAVAGMTPQLTAECWGYEVWTPVYANRIVDITRGADAKWEALRQYESQNGRLDYLTSTQGLNAFRQRSAYKAAGFAEAFFAASLSDYRDLYIQMTGHR